MKLIIGLTGFSCTGKGTFCNYISNEFAIPKITVGDLLRKEVLKRGLELNPVNIVKVSDTIRKETNNNFLLIAKDKIAELSIKNDVIIVDSLREEKDYETLRQFSHHIETVAIISSGRTRFERMSKRKRAGDPASWQEFLALENKDNLLGVGQLIKAAGYTVKNQGSLDELYTKAIDLIGKIKAKYSWI